MTASPSLQLTSEQESLVMEHLHLVRFIALRVYEKQPPNSARPPFEDLVSAGVAGLCDAVTRFNPTKKVLFRSYAQHRIYGAIIDDIRTLDPSTRALRRISRDIAEVIQTQAKALGRMPDELEIAAELQMGLVTYQDTVTELDGLEADDLSIEAMGEIEGPQDRNPLYQMLRSELKLSVERGVLNLPWKERQVLNMYFMEEFTMKEIGYMLGIGESRVSQISSDAIKHLRSSLGRLIGS